MGKHLTNSIYEMETSKSIHIIHIMKCDCKSINMKKIIGYVIFTMRRSCGGTGKYSQLNRDKGSSTRNTNSPREKVNGKIYPKARQKKEKCA